MGGILGQWRILTAMLLATVLIGGAVVLARSTANPPVAQASDESALLAAVATRDSDDDGLTDWEEALYGTDPHKEDTQNLGMTDGEAVARGLIIPKAIADVPEAGSGEGALVSPDLPRAPAEGTLTAAFAHNLFTTYLDTLQSRDGPLSETDLTDVTNKALAGLASSVMKAPPFKRAGDLKVEGSGPDAMRAYAIAAEAVMKANTANASESELVYLKIAIENDDTSALARVASIAKAYRASSAGIAALPVPQELARDGLAVVNVLAHSAEVTNDFTLVNSDPLVTMLALQQYTQATLDLVDAFIGLAKTYRAAGITFPLGSPGASFVNLVDDIAAEQRAAAGSTGATQP